MLKVKCKSCSELLSPALEQLFCSCKKVFVNPLEGENFTCGWVTGTYQENIELVREDGSTFEPQSGNADQAEQV